MESLLGRLHVSRSVLYRRFGAVGRASPAVELRRARLARAQKLLLQSGESMTEIAAACGFEHVSQLSREIRRATGQSPTQLRSRGRPGEPELHGTSAREGQKRRKRA